VEASIKEGGSKVAEDVVFAPTGEVIARAGDASRSALAALRKAVAAERPRPRRRSAWTRPSPT
jgi:hypothetical protein